MEAKYMSLTDEEQELCRRILNLTRPWIDRYAAMIDGPDKDKMIFNALQQFYLTPEVDGDLRMFARKLAVKIEQPHKLVGEFGQILKLPQKRKRGGTPTKAQKRRWTIMQDIGCIPCLLEGELRSEDRYGTPPDMDHLVSGYREGHERTYASCPYHHRGVPPIDAHNIFALKQKLGPSKAIQPQQFHDRYGSDEDLLLIQEQEIKVFLDKIA